MSSQNWNDTLLRLQLYNFWLWNPWKKEAYGNSASLKLKQTFFTFFRRFMFFPVYAEWNFADLYKLIGNLVLHIIYLLIDSCIFMFYLLFLVLVTVQEKRNCMSVYKIFLIWERKLHLSWETRHQLFGWVSSYFYWAHKRHIILTILVWKLKYEVLLIFIFLKTHCLLCNRKITIFTKYFLASVAVDFYTRT